MPDTITPNYSLIKPEVTGSVDTWGGKLNGNFDALDAALKPVSDKAGTALQRLGTLATRTATDYLFLDSALDPSLQAAGALMTNGAVRALLNALCPVGTIVMWGGTVATIPAGWALCDGRTVGSVTTPNLTDKFILQTGAHAPGFAGGSSVFSYSGNVGGHVLTAAEMPAHNHAMYDPGHVHSLADPGHQHSVPQGGGSGPAAIGSGAGTFASTGGQATSVVGTGASIATGYTGVQTYNAGSSQAHDHPIAFTKAADTWYPPYYVLCVIMRVQAF